MLTRSLNQIRGAFAPLRDTRSTLEDIIMAWGIPDHRKTKRVFEKREAELKHAIKNAYSHNKLAKSAERLRDAKLKIFKSKFSQRSVLPASHYESTDEALEWEKLSVDEIISKYNF